MIFVTLGTHQDPFERLVGGLDGFAGEELVVQHGHSPAPACADRTFDFLPFADMLEFVQTARVVVTHAGVGSILMCLKNGRTPLVVPRHQALGEHVDDHQVELTHALAKAGKVIPVWDVAMFRQLAAVTWSPVFAREPIKHELHTAVRNALKPTPSRWRWRGGSHARATAA